MFVKAQLHFHTNCDPKDTFIKYSPYEAIDRAAQYGYNVVSFTHHLKIVFDKERRKYAYSKWIILIPGVEYEINKQHILIFNPDESLYNVKTFEDLYEYKNSRKNIFIIAPHPFYPVKQCLRRNLFAYHYIFDAVEFSSLYTKKFWNNPNLLAKKYSVIYNKPLVWNSDIHDLKFIDDTYTYVNVDFDPKNLDIAKNDFYVNNFFENIRANNISLVSTPFTFTKFMKHNLFFVKWRMTKYSKLMAKKLIRKGS